jgi:hypothetical protein
MSTILGVREARHAPLPTRALCIVARISHYVLVHTHTHVLGVCVIFAIYRVHVHSYTYTARARPSRDTNRRARTLRRRRRRRRRRSRSRSSFAVVIRGRRSRSSFAVVVRGRRSHAMTRARSRSPSASSRGRPTVSAWRRRVIVPSSGASRERPPHTRAARARAPAIDAYISATDVGRRRDRRDRCARGW